jgi:nicotinate phosphoribosyltransferase
MQEGTPLVEKVMNQGRRLLPAPDLANVAAYTKSQLQSLPENLRQLAVAPAYPVEIAPALINLMEEAERSIG